MSIIKQILRRMVLEKARHLSDKSKIWFKKEYLNLKKSPENWKNSDFETLAALMDVSNSTVKRLFECKGYKTQENFNSQIREKLIRFLEYNSWEEVEKACYLYILQNGIGKS